MILKGFDLIKFPYLLYVFEQTGLSKQCRPRIDAAERMWNLHLNGDVPKVLFLNKPHMVYV